MAKVTYGYTRNGKKEICTADGAACPRHNWHTTGAKIKNDKLNFELDEVTVDEEGKFLSMDDYHKFLDASNDLDRGTKFKTREFYTNDEEVAELMAAVEPFKGEAEKLYQELGLQKIREEGIGTNFKVLNPEDGYRKDNSLWFGTCSVCEAHVSNSRFTHAWTHSISSPIYDKDGKPYSSGRSMKDSYACPEAI